ncbi:molecular chaperone TorD family protein [Raoultibacter phocaeensis]|uniref:molecular chaperone TorD family protein n=1 Tax=Raoultibacter phocaeensis TaxID=2479841 RepID=UPI0015D5BACA|nr:molecular chaperone TorD family protein [Raoultibacter phocaeensis]
MQRASYIVNAIESIGVMFTRLDEEEYRETSAPDAWEPVRQAVERYRSESGCAASARYASADGVFSDGTIELAQHALIDRCSGLAAGTLKPPTWPIRRMLQNEVLVAGMPLAALPVESLYRPWSQAKGNNYGAQRGLYLGDAAQHVLAIYDALGVTVPEAFAAMPDHLALELDLLELFLESGNEEAARSFASDHFDWLGEYDNALAARSEEVERARMLDDEKKDSLRVGIAHLRALVALVDLLAADVAQNGIAEDACEGAHASACDAESAACADEGVRALTPACAGASA